MLQRKRYRSDHGHAPDRNPGARVRQRCSVRRRGNEIREGASLKRAAKPGLQAPINSRNAHLQQFNQDPRRWDWKAHAEIANCGRP
jgi:hypothetical protein